MYNVLSTPRISSTAKAAKHVSRGWGDKPQAGGQETWLEHGIEMSGSRKEMRGIFFHERLTQGIKNPIQNVDLWQSATTAIPSSKSSVAICTNAL